MTEQIIQKYVDMPHAINVRKDDEGFVVMIPDLSGCISQGDTLEEAYSMILDAKRAWIESAIQEGEKIPEPSDEKKYGGKILLRIPPQLHEDLATMAQNQDISLNQYLIYLLTKENQKVEFHYHQTNQISVDKVEVYNENVKGHLARY